MAKAKLKKGLFITFEGPEGCGKSTHAQELYKLLQTEGFECINTREPGGTYVGEGIRKILLNPKGGKISPLTELMLFETARSQIVNEVILPALKKKKIVICDRFSDSTIAYQGYAGKSSIDEIVKLNKIVTKNVNIDLTLLLDLKVKKGLMRASSVSKKDRIELRSIEFHENVRKGFLALAAKNRGRIKVIKVRPRQEATFAAVKKEALLLINKNR